MERTESPRRGNPSQAPFFWIISSPLPPMTLLSPKYKAFSFAIKNKYARLYGSLAVLEWGLFKFIPSPALSSLSSPHCCGLWTSAVSGSAASARRACADLRVCPWIMMDLLGDQNSGMIDAFGVHDYVLQKHVHATQRNA